MHWPKGADPNQTKSGCWEQYCITSLSHLTTFTSSSPSTAGSSVGSSSVVVGPRNAPTVMSQSSAGNVEVHLTKLSLTARQVQCHICYVHRSLGLSTGMLGGWSPQAQEMFANWLVMLKKSVASEPSGPEPVSDGNASPPADPDPAAVPVRENEFNAKSKKNKTDEQNKKSIGASSSSSSDADSDSSSSSSEDSLAGRRDDDSIHVEHPIPQAFSMFAAPWQPRYGRRIRHLG